MISALQTLQVIHHLPALLHNTRQLSGGLFPLSGCTTPSAGTTSTSSSSGTNPYTSFFVAQAVVTTVLIIGCLAASLMGGYVQLSRAAHLRVILPAAAISIVALLELAWVWQLNSTYNDSGCVVYVQTAPIDSNYANNFAAFMLLGVSVAALVFIVLGIVLSMHGLRRRRALRLAH